MVRVALLRCMRNIPQLRLLRPTVSQKFSASPYDYGLHRSDAEILVNKVPVIEIKGNMAVCDGGGGALGHPIEYIQLNRVYGSIGICKYCGLRFKKAEGSHGHH